MNRGYLWLVLFLVTLLLTGCAGFLANESAELSSQDAPEAVRITAALLDEPGLAGSAIDVQFEKGRVTLSGFVETQEQRQRAEQIARQQEGVTEVINNIEIK